MIVFLSKDSSKIIIVISAKITPVKMVWFLLKLIGCF